MPRLIYSKAGFDENSITDYIKKYLNPDICFNFGWGSLSQELIKNPIPVPQYDRKTLGIYNGPKGQSDVVQQVIDFVRDKSGKSISREQIMLTNGATNAIFLLSHYFYYVKNIHKVVLQSPVFDTALNIFNSLKFEKIAVEPGCREIPEVQNSFAYLIFKYQNPTGISLSSKKRLEIINSLTSQGNFVVEDDSYGLLDLKGKINFAKNPSYIYISSFSKYIFPGLRMGYIIASPEVISDLQIIQKYYNSHPNVMSQYILCEYLQHGLVEDELIFKREQIKQKRQIFETNISLKIKAKLDPSNGGFYYWLRLAPNISSVNVFVDLLKQGIITIPGDIYFSDTPYPALRICISLIDKEKIVDGCKLLNKYLEKYV